jgi:hypothetical protein
MRSEGKGKDEKKHLQTADGVRRKKPEHSGNRAVRAFRAKRDGGDLAIRGPTGHADLLHRANDRTDGKGWFYLVKLELFDNE